MNSENNILIAEFMGYGKGSDFQYLKHPDTEYDTDIDTLLYHSSWDWLMQVVEKINSLGYHVSISCGAWSIVQVSKRNITLIHTHSQEDSLMLAIYNSCVRFIEYYEENK